jgi:hypothetical protein
VVPGGKPWKTPGTELSVVAQHHEIVRRYQSVRWSDSSCEIQVANLTVGAVAVWNRIGHSQTDKKRKREIITDKRLGNSMVAGTTDIVV